MIKSLFVYGVLGGKNKKLEVSKIKLFLKKNQACFVLFSSAVAASTTGADLRVRGRRRRLESGLYDRT